MAVSVKSSVTNLSESSSAKRKPARSWGDINLTLNRLVREGVISGFKTNLSSPDRQAGIQVAITAQSGEPGREEEIRERVSHDLEALVDDVEISVEMRQAA